MLMDSGNNGVLKAAANGQSIWKVSQTIPYSPFKGRCKPVKCFGLSLGRKCVFTAQDENYIASHVLLLKVV
jgi:hypothetical protein